jgi:hypothetical protein
MSELLLIAKVAGLILIGGSVAATVVICLNKWGIIALYQVYRRAWMPGEVCDFCLCFWLSIPLIFYISDISYIAAGLAALGSASIGKTIINFARN